MVQASLSSRSVIAARVLNPDQLRSFRAVMEARHFSAAARALGLRQSTVSQHVARLEAATGRTLLLRDTHRVVPTADGETLLGFAREILDAEARASAWLAGTASRDRIRLGVSEDLAMDRLPAMLGRFTRDHPGIDLDLTVGLSGHLGTALDAGRLDLVFAKREAARDGAPEGRGRLVWRERPVWVAGPLFALGGAETVPLVAFDDLGSITRRLATRALDGAGRPWRLAATSGHLTGLLAAVKAGIGVSLQSRQVLGGGLVEADPAGGLPVGAPIEFVVTGRAAHLHGPAALLADAIVGNAETLRPAA